MLEGFPLGKRIHMKIHSAGVRSISWMMLAALLSQGCTSYHNYEPGNAGEIIEEVNTKGAERKSRIATNDGYLYSATKLHIRPDSSFWYAGEDLQPISRQTPEINEVILIDRSKGAGEGFLLAAIPIIIFTGIVAINASLNPTMCDGSEFCIDPEPDAIAMAGLGTAVVGGLLFASAGYLIGHQDVYRFSSDAYWTGVLKQWGFKAGRTWATQSWEGSAPSSWYNPNNVSWEPGIHIGCYAEWFDYQNFSITTGVNYEEKGFEYYVGERQAAVHSRYSYISLPIAVKYSIRRGFVRPYILGGPRIDFFTGSADDDWGVASSYNDFIFGLSYGGGIEFWSDKKRSIFLECIYNQDLTYASEAEPLYPPGTSVKIKNESVNLSLGIGFN